MAATRRVPRSLARLVEIVLPVSRGVSVLDVFLVGGTERGGKLTSKAPYHDGVRNPNCKRRAYGAHKRIRGVQTCPDHNADVTTHKEFLEEQIPLIALVWVGE